MTETLTQPAPVTPPQGSLGTRALMDITARPPVVFTRGAGAYLWDDSGRRYIDFVQGWAVNALGHAPPLIADVLAKQGATRRCSNYCAVVAGGQTCPRSWSLGHDDGQYRAAYSRCSASLRRAD